jgi:alkylation response protein AidB-like acyl-CoA dehydrogenase
MTSSNPAGARIEDETLRTIHHQCREAAADLPEVGMALDRDPDSIPDFLHLPAFRILKDSAMPREYREPENLLGVEFAGTCLENAVMLEAISYGDPGTILANQGPGLSRDLVIALGDQAQRDTFFTALVPEGTWSFFGLTEQEKGSAALELETTLTPTGEAGHWLLNGEKRYVGNGARSQIAVVFARRAPGPWGVEAVLIDTDHPGFSGELLPMIGLRGARISRMRFDNIPIAPEQIIGRHRPPSRRGLYGALQALFRFRPGLGAMMLGQAQAVVDYVLDARPNLTGLDLLRLAEANDRLAAVRRQVHDIAIEADNGVLNSHRIGAVKMRAVRVGEQTTLLAAELLGPAALVEHPWLEKAYRDMRGFEFMEGTTNIHKLSVFQGLLKGDYFATESSAAA